MIPRAARNNNPGNVNGGQPWQGLMPVAQQTPEQRAEPRFAVFQSPEWGFRAMTVLLHNYQVIYGCKTVAEIIARWAPSSENKTDLYAEFICHALRVPPGAPYDVTNRANMFALIKAITREETGSWEPYWTDAELNKGLDMTYFYAPAIGTKPEPAVPPLAA